MLCNLDGEYIQAGRAVDSHVPRLLGSASAGTHRDIKASLKKSGIATWEITSLGDIKIIEIRTPENEVFFLGPRSPEISPQSYQSQKLQVSRSS